MYSLANNFAMLRLENGSAVGLVLHGQAKLLYGNQPTLPDSLNTQGKLSTISQTSETLVTTPNSVLAKKVGFSLDNPSETAILDPGGPATLTLRLAALKEPGESSHDAYPITGSPWSDICDDLSPYQTEINDYTTEWDGGLFRRIIIATDVFYNFCIRGLFYREEFSVDELFEGCEGSCKVEEGRGEGMIEAVQGYSKWKAC